MIKAMMYSKGTVNGEQSFSERFRNYEDLLTAAFFSRLEYLPDDEKVKLIEFISDVENLSEKFGNYVKIRYWERKNIKNVQKKVEPDIIIEFEKGIVVIELKLNSEHTEAQCIEQLEFIKNDEKGSLQNAYVLLGKHKAKVNLPNVIVKQWQDIERFLRMSKFESNHVNAIKDAMLFCFETFKLNRFYTINEMVKLQTDFTAEDIKRINLMGA